MPTKIKEIKNSSDHAYDPWTSEADERLVDLYLQGKSENELSEIFGRTKGAIRSRIKKLSL